MPRPSPQTRSVDLFMAELYKSAAEPLPEAFDPGEWADDRGAPDDNAEIWNTDLPVPEEIRAMTGDVLGVPVRHLPHGKPHDLYLQYLAWHQIQLERGGEGVERCDEDADVATEPASLSTFWRCWTYKWRNYLCFRKSSQHACCQTCFDLKQAIQAARGDLGTKVARARQLQAHLRAQYADRQLYWNLRRASRQNQNVLTIVIDAMDKSKFAVPRYSYHRRPKDLDGLQRPRLCCTAALAHGWLTSIFLSDECVNHGADAFVEIVLRVLEMVSKVSKETGRPFPQHLVIQADNTTSQCKNQIGLTFLALLVARFKFITTNLFFLRVGHTHEDIGLRPGVTSGLIAVPALCRATLSSQSGLRAF